MTTTLRTMAGALVAAAMLTACDGRSWITWPDEQTRSAAVERFSTWSEPMNLGSTVNSPHHELIPEISPDGLSLYFTSGRPGGFGRNDLWVSSRPTMNDSWSEPANLGPVINSPGNDAAPSISRDGHYLFFSSTRAGGVGGNDLYVSWRADPQDDLAWEAPVNLGAPVNSSRFDAGASFRRPELYFASNRADPLLSIYVSRAQGWEFSTPERVAELSSSANDQRPSIRSDGLEIFLSSNRPGGIGGQDIWSSSRPHHAAPWSGPVNLGATINTGHFDQQPSVSDDGRFLFFASNRPGGEGGLDLYMAMRSVNPR